MYMNLKENNAMLPLIHVYRQVPTLYPKLRTGSGNISVSPNNLSVKLSSLEKIWKIYHQLIKS